MMNPARSRGLSNRKLAPVNPFDLVSRDAAASYGVSGRVMTCLGRGVPTADLAANFQANLELMTSLHSEGFGLITVIRETSTPSPEARDVLLSAFRASQDKFAAALFVVEATGFTAALQRSILTGITLLGKLRSRIRITQRLDDELTWFTDLLARDGNDILNASDLRSAVEAFCEREDRASLPPVMLRHA